MERRAHASEEGERPHRRSRGLDVEPQGGCRRIGQSREGRARVVEERSGREARKRKGEEKEKEKPFQITEEEEIQEPRGEREETQRTYGHEDKKQKESGGGAGTNRYGSQTRVPQEDHTESQKISTRQEEEEREKIEERQRKLLQWEWERQWRIRDNVVQQRRRDPRTRRPLWNFVHGEEDSRKIPGSSDLPVAGRVPGLSTDRTWTGVECGGGRDATSGSAVLPTERAAAHVRAYEPRVLDDRNDDRLGHARQSGRTFGSRHSEVESSPGSCLGNTLHSGAEKLEVIPPDRTAAASLEETHEAARRAREEAKVFAKASKRPDWNPNPSEGSKGPGKGKDGKGKKGKSKDGRGKGGDRGGDGDQKK